MNGLMVRRWTFGVWRPAALGIVSVLFGMLTVVMFIAAFLLVTTPDPSDDTSPAAVFITALGLLMTALFAPLIREFSIALRYRLSVDQTGFDYRVPIRWIGLSPFPRFTTGRIEWKDVASVTRRDEVVQAFGIPTTLAACSVLTQTGQRVEPARNKAGPQQILPVDEIAELIARNSGLTVSDLGTVEVPGLLAATRGAAASWDERDAPPALNEETVRRYGHRERLALKVIGFALTIAVVLRACIQNW